MTISLQNISKNYGNKKILNNFDLEIPRNSFVLLKGKSGSGKTTLLKIIGGIEQPSTGNVYIDKQKINLLKGRKKVDFYRHKIGFIFQDFQLQPQLAVGENIELPGIFAGISKEKRRKRLLELATLLGIQDILKQYPEEISGGQAERTCIARSLFMRPDIILADEPTNNLDSENITNILKLLIKFHQENEATVIISSHNPIIQKLATHTISITNHCVDIEMN